MLATISFNLSSPNSPPTSENRINRLLPKPLLPLQNKLGFSTSKDTTATQSCHFSNAPTKSGKLPTMGTFTTSLYSDFSGKFPVKNRNKTFLQKKLPIKVIKVVVPSPKSFPPLIRPRTVIFKKKKPKKSTSWQKKHILAKKHFLSMSPNVFTPKICFFIYNFVPFKPLLLV